MIPLFKVFMSPFVMEYLSPVLKSGYIGEGPKSKEFEERIGEFIGNPKVLIMNSGTAAITIALRLAGVREGDSVITTPMTCLATNMPILSLGAKPIWADVLPDGTLDPDSVEKLLPARAIIVMDWGGKPCKLDEFKKFNVPIIEDACQAFGSEYKGRKLGADADYVCFSFQAIKQLTTVDGGALVCNYVPSRLERGRLMRWFGLDRTKSNDLRCFQDPPTWGYKCQPNDVISTIGLANLGHLPWIIKTTRQHAAFYDDVLGRKEDPDRKSCYWLYTVFVDDQAEFIAYMKENGVECSRVHDRNDTKTIFEDHPWLPGVDYFDTHHVCIPVGWWLKDEDVNHIANLIKGRAT